MGKEGMCFMIYLKRVVEFLLVKSSVLLSLMAEVSAKKKERHVPHQAGK